MSNVTIQPIATFINNSMDKNYGKDSVKIADEYLDQKEKKAIDQYIGKTEATATFIETHVAAAIKGKASNDQVAIADSLSKLLGRLVYMHSKGVQRNFDKAFSDRTDKSVNKESWFSGMKARTKQTLSSQRNIPAVTAYKSALQRAFERKGYHYSINQKELANPAKAILFLNDDQHKQATEAAKAKRQREANARKAKEANAPIDAKQFNEWFKKAEKMLEWGKQNRNAKKVDALCKKIIEMEVQKRSEN